MKSLKLLLCVALIAGLAGCSAVSVSTEYDENVDFSEYQSFGWFPQKNKPGPRNPLKNQMLENSLKQALRQELEDKGYTFVREGRADFRIAYHVGLQNRVSVDTYGYGHWRRRVHTEVHHYKEGTLIVDFIDPRQKQLLWRGWASAVMNNPKMAEDRIKEAVTKILAAYPPQ